MKLSEWDNSYSRGRTPWREPEKIGERVKKWLNIAEVHSGTALDLGTGSGEIATELAKSGFDVEALDYSKAALKIARTLSSKVTWVKWNLEQLEKYNFKVISYDLIVDHKTLAFIEEGEKYLDTIKSHLGGVFILTVFHEHDEKPSICVTKSEFNKLIPPRFRIFHREIFTSQQGKVAVNYFLRKR